MGQCLKNCEGTFLLKMSYSTAILVCIFSILMLDQFSRRRKMRIIGASTIQNPKKRQNTFCLKVITVLSWKITNFENFPSENSYDF